MLKLYKFKTRGLGIITTNVIEQNTVVGNYLEKTSNNTSLRYIFNGWFESKFLGRYLNSNSNPNCTFIEDKNTIKVITKEKIKPNTELTVDYFQIAKIIKLPNEKHIEYGIKYFEYIDEVIDLNFYKLI